MEIIANLHQQLQNANTELMGLQQQTEQLVIAIQKVQDNLAKRAQRHSEAIRDIQELQRLVEEEKRCFEISKSKLTQLEAEGTSNEKAEEQRMMLLLHRLDANRGRQNATKACIDHLVGEFVTSDGWKAKLEEVQTRITSLKTTARGESAVSHHEIHEQTLGEWIEREQFSYTACRLIRNIEL